MLRAGAGPPLEGSVRALRLACLLALRPPASLPASLPRFLPSFHVCLLPSSHASPPSLLPSLLPCFLASLLASSHLASPPSSPPACMGPQGNTAYGPCINPLLPTPAGAVHTQTFNQHHPPLRLLGLSTREQFAQLPHLTSLEGTTNLSSCIGLSTIIRHGAIGYRTDSLFQIANTL